VQLALADDREVGALVRAGEEVGDSLSKAQASERIEELQAKTGRGT